MFTATIILFVLLAAAMAASFARKATRAPASGALRDRLGVPDRLWRATGGLELAAAAGLLAGLAVAPLGIAAAVGVALLMAGAVLAHLRRGIAGRALTAPLVLLAVAVLATALRIGTA
jgi:peptidoglycan/LPS O-acetylase OafA/YrhL